LIITVINPFKAGVSVKKACGKQHRRTLSAPKKVKGEEKRSSRLLRRKININTNLGCGNCKED